VAADEEFEFKKPETTDVLNKKEIDNFAKTRMESVSA